MLTIDMEMPSSCNECPFRDYEEGRCLATEKVGDPHFLGTVTPRDGRKPKWCPIKCEIKTVATLEDVINYPILEKNYNEDSKKMRPIEGMDEE